MKGRAFIIGLDSATFDVIDPLIDEGRLPNFATLKQRGAVAPMLSTHPSRTAPAWVTLLTGQNPGKHGIFDFWTRRRDGYDSVLGELVTSANFAGRTFFDLLGSDGWKVASLFVPMTFPAWEIRGQMIAGPPLTPDSDDRLSTPLRLHEELGVCRDVHLFPPSLKKGIHDDKTVRDLLRMDESRAEAAFRLWEQEDSDCLMVVLEAIDIVQHRFWPCSGEGSGCRFGLTIPRFYELADRVIGEARRRLKPQDTLYVVSDHGMTAHPQRCFNTNAWLASRGWLSFSTRGARVGRLANLARHAVHRAVPEALYNSLKTAVKASSSSAAQKVRMAAQSQSGIDWRRTSAYRVQMPDPPLEGIMLNIRGRQPEGTVSEQSVRDVLEVVRQALLDVVDPATGRSVVKAAHAREEIYTGANAHDEPDLIVEFEEGYKAGSALLGELFSPTPAVEIERLSGTHSSRGIFLAAGPPFSPGKKADPIQIQDFAPTFLYACGRPVPDVMDGRVALGLFQETFTDRHAVESCSGELAGPSREAALDAQETAQMEEKLRALGYL